MNKTFFACILVMLLVFLAGCSNRYRSDDPFYYSAGDWDSIRFPLIKPYEAVNLQQGNGWYINLYVSPAVKEIYYYLNLQNVQKISVMKDAILVYTPYEKDVNEEMGEKNLFWFVIIPAESIETGFDNENDFLNYIQEYGINEVSWETPDTLYQSFLDTGCLAWIPGCQ